VLADHSGARRSPVLHFDPVMQRLWVFFSQSNYCKRSSSPPTWDPGGNVKTMFANVSQILTKPAAGTVKWSPPRTILPQSTDGVPKVIASQLVVLSSGDWVLPFWGEQPHFVKHSPRSDCDPANPDNEVPGRNFTDRSAAGVLISVNQGRTWAAHGRMSSPHTQLLEGVVVELPPKLV
ncbi:hypothetical protein CYMTET_30625, partial [Cymbomonas tetramitiformis]